MKIIQLHRLFGFETFVVSQHMWDKLLKKHNAKKVEICFECFVWDDDKAEPCLVHGMAEQTYGYRSYWKLKDGETERDRLMEELKNHQKEVFFKALDKEEAKKFRDLLLLLKKDSDLTNITALDITDIKNQVMAHVEKYRL